MYSREEKEEKRSDNGGNRRTKTDALTEIEVVYEYDIDVDDREVYGTYNNRLEYYETYDLTDPDPVLVSTTWYYYNESGNVTHVVTNEAGTDDYSATRLSYAKNARTVTYVLGETWNWNADLRSCPTEYQVTYARAFDYYGARQRYRNRELSPGSLMAGHQSVVSQLWSDYDGDDIYGDFTVSSQRGSVANEERSYEPGVGTVDDPLGAAPRTEYYHTDLIGTTRFMSDAAGAPIEPTVYTAFGERISGTNPRYGYAGAWGYQSHDEFPFLHVGARYYDPSTGRFLQRDPIGIRGGVNVYEYVLSHPTVGIDPSGLGWDDFEKWKPSPGNDPNDPRVPQKYGGEDPVGHTEEEIEDIKKFWVIAGGESGVGAGLSAGGLAPGGWIPALACALTLLIDEIWHWDEPSNPIFGGK